MSERIAIVGAGLAGLACARRLADAGAEVTVFEKSRGPGGRCATRRTEVGPFHHGAPSFGAHSPAFQAEVARWQAAGWVAADARPGRWVGWPTMNALARRLAAGLKIVTEATVTALVRDDEAAGAGRPAWRLVVAEAAAGDAVRAPFDAVVVAVPVEQALPLAAASATLQAPLRAVRSDACWTLMVAWPAAAAPAVAPALPEGGPLAAIVDCSRLPLADAAGTPAPATRWALHGSAAWSRAHVEDTPGEAAAALLQALSAACGGALAAPAHAVAHRWRYAQVVAPAAAPCGWDAALRLGGCGDAWHGAAVAGLPPLEGVERAWLSAAALADALADTLLQSPARSPSSPAPVP